MSLHTDELLLKTQADGAEVFTLASGFQTLMVHQIQVVPSATPTAGVLEIAVKTPGNTPGFDKIGEIDMVNGPLIARFEALAKEIQITPVGFDAAKTYGAYLACGMVA